MEDQISSFVLGVLCYDVPLIGHFSVTLHCHKCGTHVRYLHHRFWHLQSQMSLCECEINITDK